ncbi:MAG: CPBP family intramembrane metalloprotease [Defluviitaleaceae bacterium]|nr:CPBP family intramembrane metalloprotease [Defluviitaleaceae bacterium]
MTVYSVILNSVENVTLQGQLMTNLQGQVMVMLFQIACLAVTIAVVLIRKQSLASIGIHKQNLRPALRLGLLFSIIPLGASLLPGLVGGWSFFPLWQILFNLLLSLVSATYQDTTYIGFVQTRVYGLFKNGKLAIIVVAILFALMHLPFQIITQGANFWGLHVILMVALWALGHWVFLAVFRKYFSLIPAIFVHTMINFSQGFIWQESIGIWAGVATYSLFISVGIWVRLSSRSRANFKEPSK